MEIIKKAIVVFNARQASEKIQEKGLEVHVAQGKLKQGSGITRKSMVIVTLIKWMI